MYIFTVQCLSGFMPPLSFQQPSYTRRMCFVMSPTSSLCVDTHLSQPQTSEQIHALTSDVHAQRLRWQKCSSESQQWQRPSPASGIRLGTEVSGPDGGRRGSLLTSLMGWGWSVAPDRVASKPNAGPPIDSVNT
uniref:Uncharacterized protein n=1 Tax=Myotis myotis TaxID=51298 RepID=A0A7J7WIB8_MYOMY|nr:hypothetical protein mMyoMyo1_012149 [Myotis myotis]